MASDLHGSPILSILLPSIWHPPPRSHRGGQGFESPQLHQVKHCANRVRFVGFDGGLGRGVARWGGVRSGDLEDRDDFFVVGDADFRDQVFDGGLAFG